MSNFRTFATAVRTPAISMQRVVDPAGWSAKDLQDVESWGYRLSSADVDDLASAVERVRASGISLVDIPQRDWDLGRFGEIVADVRHELIDGRGIVMLRNFPVDSFDREATAIAYLVLGARLGQIVSQNKQGHVLGHVKDLGEDYSISRGNYSKAELQFHSDGVTFVGLLCLHPAMRGGTSRVASAVTIYNRMLQRRPELVAVLTRDFYRSRAQEIDPGQVPWIKQSIFAFQDGYFSAIGPGSSIDKAQRLPGVPPLEPIQKEAIRFYRDMAEEYAADIEFQRGDIQFLNGFVTLHSRRSYEDWPDAARRRHLLRVWVNDPKARPVPDSHRTGRATHGVRLTGIQLSAPLDVLSMD